MEATLCDFSGKRIKLGLVNMEPDKTLTIGADWLSYNHFLIGGKSPDGGIMFLGHLNLPPNQKFSFQELAEKHHLFNSSFSSVENFAS